MAITQGVANDNIRWPNRQSKLTLINPINRDVKYLPRFRLDIQRAANETVSMLNA